MIRKLLFSLMFLVGLLGFCPAQSTADGDTATSVTLGDVTYKVSALSTNLVIVPKAEVVIPDPLPPVFSDLSATADSIRVTVSGNPSSSVQPNLVAVILIEGGDVNVSNIDVVNQASQEGTILTPDSEFKFSVTPSTVEARTFTLVAVSLQAEP